MSESISFVDPLATVEEQTFAAATVSVPKAASEAAVVEAVAGQVKVLYAQASQAGFRIAPQTIAITIAEHEDDLHATVFAAARGWKAVIQ